MLYALTEASPLERFWDFRREFDRLFDEAFPFGRPEEGRSTPFVPAFEWQEDADALSLRVEIPGVEPEKLNVSVTGRVLTVEGERWSKSDDENLHRNERSFGKFSKSLHLPEQYDLSEIEAKHENGILTLRIPKSPEAKPRQIRIEAH